MNVNSVIKSIRNIMRQDKGVNGDAQRLEQLGWMLFLKIFDAKDEDLGDPVKMLEKFRKAKQEMEALQNNILEELQKAMK